MLASADFRAERTQVVLTNADFRAERNSVAWKMQILAVGKINNLKV